MSILEKTPKERSLPRPSFIRPYVAPLVPFVAAVGLLEWLVDRGSLPVYLVPKPSMVFAALFSERAMLGQAFIQTATAAAVGLGMSLVVGFATAFLLSLSRTLRSAFYPYATFFQTVPIVAIAPLLVIWFGYGLPTVIASAFICSLFPVIASTLLGLQSTDPGLIDLLRIYDTSRFRHPLGLPHPLCPAPNFFRSAHRLRTRRDRRHRRRVYRRGRPRERDRDGAEPTTP